MVFSDSVMTWAIDYAENLREDRHPILFATDNAGSRVYTSSARFDDSAALLLDLTKPMHPPAALTMAPDGELCRMWTFTAAQWSELRI